MGDYEEYNPIDDMWDDDVEDSTDYDDTDYDEMMETQEYKDQDDSYYEDDDNEPVSDFDTDDSINITMDDEEEDQSRREQEISDDYDEREREYQNLEQNRLQQNIEQEQEKEPVKAEEEPEEIRNDYALDDDVEDESAKSKKSSSTYTEYKTEDNTSRRASDKKADAASSFLHEKKDTYEEIEDDDEEDDSYTEKRFELSFGGFGFHFGAKDDENDEDYEDEEYLTLRERIKFWLLDATPSGLIKKGVLVFLIIYYLLMTSFQAIFGIINPGVETTHSYNPFTVLFNFMSINGSYLLLFLFVDLAIMAGIGLMLARNNHVKKNGEVFTLSKNGTYGTAKYASDEEITDKELDFAPLHHPDGVPIGINKNLDAREGGVSVCINHDKATNEHAIVYGSSGSGKSFCIVRSEILYCIENRKSAIISDPSGEMYYDTSKLAREQGFDVKVLNLTNFYASNGWNPFSLFNGMNSMELQTAVTMFVSTIMTNISDGAGKSDSFFDMCEENLLIALVSYVAISPEFEKIGKDYERHLGTVYDILQKLSAKADDGYQLDYMDELPDEDPAKAAWDIFNGAGKLKSNIVLGLASKLKVLQNNAVKEVLSHDEIDMRAPGHHPCIYYVISDVMNGAFTFIMSLFYSCTIEQLVQYGKKYGNNNKLPVPTYFIFDELPSIGRISEFDKKIANVRKYDIAFTLIVQDPSQLDSVYGKEKAPAIISNCATKIILKVNDQNTAKNISDRCGEATIVNESYNETHSKLAILPNAVPEMRVSTADGKRALLTPHEILTLGPFETLIIAMGQNVYRCDKYPYKQHCFASFVDKPENKAHSDDFCPPWKDGELTMDKERSFLKDNVEYKNTRQETPIAVTASKHDNPADQESINEKSMKEATKKNKRKKEKQNSNNQISGLMKNYSSDAILGGTNSYDKKERRK